MDWLNYHHLLYFWTIAKEGTMVRASELLGVGQPSLSIQMRQLEKSLGLKLFRKAGRFLELTEDGKVVYRYADEIFSLGREMLDTVRGRPTGKPVRFAVGIVDIIPKLIVKRLLEPALQLVDAVHLICVEAPLEHLLKQLAAHNLDLVLSDAGVSGPTTVRAFNHLLGESSIAIFGTPELAAQYRPGFPKSLNGAPFLMPYGTSGIRRSLESWFNAADLRPQIRAEFDDSALLQVYGQAGRGLFAAQYVMQDELCRQHNLEVVGEIPELREQFYAISPERRLRHPAVVAISSAARTDLFSGTLQP